MTRKHDAHKQSFVESYQQLLLEKAQVEKSLEEAREKYEKQTKKLLVIKHGYDAFRSRTGKLIKERDALLEDNKAARLSAESARQDGIQKMVDGAIDCREVIKSYEERLERLREDLESIIKSARAEQKRLSRDVSAYTILCCLDAEIKQAQGLLDKHFSKKKEAGE